MGPLKQRMNDYNLYLVFWVAIWRPCSKHSLYGIPNRGHVAANWVIKHAGSLCVAITPPYQHIDLIYLNLKFDIDKTVQIWPDIIKHFPCHYCCSIWICQKRPAWLSRIVMSSRISLRRNSLQHSLTQTSQVKWVACYKNACSRCHPKTSSVRFYTAKCGSYSWR